MVYEKALNIYTDGSSLSNPRRGGIGVRYVTINDQGNEDVKDDTFLGYAGATNNEMELLACIMGLEGSLNHHCFSVIERICIFTDSMYVTGNVARAKFEWPKRKWCNSDGRPIENAELWQELLRVLRWIQKRVDFEWVRGHGKNQHNKAVDKLAKQSAKGVLNRPLRITTVRRKLSAATVRRGCIRMRGQTISIRIITDTYMRTQKLYKYKYEVLPGSGEDTGKVDWIFHESKECLRAGHHYEVRVNADDMNPRIVEVIRELERETSSTRSRGR